MTVTCFVQVGLLMNVTDAPHCFSQRLIGFGWMFILAVIYSPRKLMHTTNFCLCSSVRLTPHSHWDPVQYVLTFFFTFRSSKWFQQSEQVWTLQEMHPIRRASGTSVPPFSLLGLLSPLSVRWVVSHSLTAHSSFCRGFWQYKYSHKLHPMLWKCIQNGKTFTF